MSCHVTPVAKGALWRLSPSSATLMQFYDSLFVPLRMSFMHPVAGVNLIYSPLSIFSSVPLLRSLRSFTRCLGVLAVPASLWHWMARGRDAISCGLGKYSVLGVWHNRIQHSVEFLTLNHAVDSTIWIRTAHFCWWLYLLSNTRFKCTLLHLLSSLRINVFQLWCAIGLKWIERCAANHDEISNHKTPRTMENVED